MDDVKNEPDYKFSFAIVDDNTGHVIVAGKTFLTQIEPDGRCDSVEMHVSSALRAFNNKLRQEHENKTYTEFCIHCQEPINEGHAKDCPDNI